MSRGWPQEGDEQEDRQDELACKAQGRSHPVLEDPADVGWDGGRAHGPAVLRLTQYGEQCSGQFQGESAVNKLNLLRGFDLGEVGPSSQPPHWKHWLHCTDASRSGSSCEELG